MRSNATTQNAEDSATSASRHNYLVRRYREIAYWALGSPASTRGSWTDGLFLLGLLIVGTVVAFARIPEDAVRVVWAEDGSIFLAGAFAHPWSDVVLMPYNGYAAAYPRTIAAIIRTFVSLNHVPLATTLAACFTTAGIATVIFWSLRSRIPQVGIRLVLWAAVVVLPVAGIEVSGSIANSHWYLLVGLFAVLVTRQRSVTGRILAAMLIMVTILSDPLGVIFLPLAVLRLSDEGKYSRWIVPAASAAATLVQGLVVINTALGNQAGSATLLEIARATGFRVYLEALVGHSLAVAAYGWIEGGALAIAAACIALAAIASYRLSNAGLVIISFVAGTAMFLISGVLRWFPGLDPANGQLTGATRYDIVPVLVVSIGVAAAAATIRHTRRRVLVALSWSGVGAIVVAVAISAGLDWGITARATTIPWSISLATNVELCKGAEPTKVVVLSESPAGFRFSASCRVVLRSSTRDNPF